MSLDDLVDRVDALQQRIAPVAFGVAVLKRFGEDRGSQYSALMSFYGFLSLFPLLLALTTIAGIVLDGNPELQQQVLDSVAGRIPVIGSTLEESVTGLRANGLVLAVSLVIAIFSGLGVIQATQDALNTVWDVPRHRWPDLLHRYGRNLAVLAVLGGAVICATGLAVGLRVIELPVAASVVGGLANVTLNTAVILLAFQVLVKADLRVGELLVGAFVGGVALYVLQLVGGFYLSRVVIRATDLYGAFAVVIGLAIWLNLNARVLLLAAEVDVVRTRDLWPRSLSPRLLTDADRRALRAVAAREALMDSQQITVAFGPRPGAPEPTTATDPDADAVPGADGSAAAGRDGGPGPAPSDTDG